ncbi:MAG: large conductance mechanosensitive channel protein MscL [Polyangiaceae bacterium]
MAILEDFKKFAFKGNVVDLAVGVVIGVAFQKIISALVADIIMPFVALLTPAGDWRDAGLVLRQSADPKNIVLLKYGDLLGAVLDFLIVAFVLFLVVSKIIQKIEARTKGKEPDASTKACPFCLELVDVKATRCKFCTSDLTEKPKKEVAAQPA